MSGLEHCYEKSLKQANNSFRVGIDYGIVGLLFVIFFGCEHITI